MNIFAYGVGACGMSFGLRFALKGHKVTHWMRAERKEDIELLSKLWDAPIKDYRCLYGINSPESMHFTVHHDTLDEADIVLVAIPSSGITCDTKLYYEIANRLFGNKRAVVALLSKGFDPAFKKPLGVSWYEQLRDCVWFDRFAVISGPTFASDIANEIPLKASIAGRDTSAIRILQKLFREIGIKLVATSDIEGVSWGGVVKNTYAIGDGMTAVVAPEKVSIYRRLALLEMQSILLTLTETRPKTIHSPAVRGDFLGSCSGPSRNRHFGEFIAGESTKYAGWQYRGPAETKEYLKRYTVEGYESMLKLWEMAYNAHLNTPLLSGIHAVCCFSQDPRMFSEMWLAQAEKIYKK